MSIYALSWCFKQQIRPSWVKFTLVALADCADGNDLCWPSIEHICATTSQDRKTVIKALNRLVDLGFLKDIGDRKGRTKQIKVYLIKNPADGMVGATQTVPSTDGNSTVCPSEESRPSLERVPSAVHGTIIEPSLNHQGTKNATAVQKHHQSEPDAEAHVGGNGKDRSSGNRKTQLPRTWQPTAEQLFYAEQQGCPDPKATALEFAEYYWSAGTPWMDWNLVFKRWCRKQKSFGRAPAKEKREVGLMAALGGLWDD